MFGLNKDCKRLYELGYISNSDPALLIRARKDFLNSLKIDENLFQSKDGKLGCTELIIPIPKAVTIHTPAWKPIREAVQSIALFTELARSAYMNNEASNLEKRQLISLYVVANHEHGKYAIGGDYSPLLCNWLEDIATKGDMDNIVRAMEQTYSYIWDRPRCGTFLAYPQEEGGLVLRCPSYCVVYPRSLRLKDRGIEFDSSEVMHEAEVLVLLSGLSVLCEEAGREIYGSSF